MGNCAHRSWGCMWYWHSFGYVWRLGKVFRTWAASYFSPMRVTCEVGGLGTRWRERGGGSSGSSPNSSAHGRMRWLYSCTIIMICILFILVSIVTHKFRFNEHLVRTTSRIVVWSKLHSPALRSTMNQLHSPKQTEIDQPIIRGYLSIYVIDSRRFRCVIIDSKLSWPPLKLRIDFKLYSKYLWFDTGFQWLALPTHAPSM